MSTKTKLLIAYLVMMTAIGVALAVLLLRGMQ